ncbi:TetR family transcriptional regulator [Glaciihabitans arcticus]|uniref:TetR family transcriptional regulator n=1 Tax=Glaciihabitans arcticus TaxID=2668039 RepID=A0A4Q9GWY0_9MICO|nr:TetR/AcrR family transcriptional regulator C-terminal domain-containing protein [Glaciihabitans arcticus]TBN57223.1 TetR family transcriptional regulator [Glaciihabitans arcticus]
MARSALTRARVLSAAIGLADESGVESLSMRSLGARLSVEAMSLYNHVSNKDDVLSGMTDLVWAQIDLAPGVDDWRTAVRTICVSLHHAFLRHPWSCRLHGTTAGVARLRYIDRSLMHLREGGFSAGVAYHAHHLLDGYVLGYTLQVIDYTSGDQGASDAMQELVASVSSEMPYLMEHIEQHVSGVPDEPGFEIGLDQILDGLERRL